VIVSFAFAVPAVVYRYVSVRTTDWPGDVNGVVYDVSMIPSLLKSHCHSRGFPWGSLTVPVSSTGNVVHVDEGLEVRLLIEGAVFRSATTLIAADEVTECPCPSETVTLRVYVTPDVVYVWVPGLPVPVVPSPKSQAYVRTSRTFASDANAAKLCGVLTWTACAWRGESTGATLATTGTIVDDVAVAPAEFLTVTWAVKVPTAAYWWLAVGMAVVVTAEPSPQFQVYWVSANPAGSLAEAARVSVSPAYVVGSNGLNDSALIFGEPVAGA
jgi:hypothetical protein